MSTTDQVTKNLLTRLHPLIKKSPLYVELIESFATELAISFEEIKATEILNDPEACFNIEYDSSKQGNSLQIAIVPTDDDTVNPDLTAGTITQTSTYSLLAQKFGGFLNLVASNSKATAKLDLLTLAIKIQNKGTYYGYIFPVLLLNLIDSAAAPFTAEVFPYYYNGSKLVKDIDWLTSSAKAKLASTGEATPNRNFSTFTSSHSFLDTGIILDSDWELDHKGNYPTAHFGLEFHLANTTGIAAKYFAYIKKALQMVQDITQVSHIGYQLRKTNLVSSPAISTISDPFYLVYGTGNSKDILLAADSSSRVYQHKIADENKLEYATNPETVLITENYPGFRCNTLVENPSYATEKNSLAFTLGRSVRPKTLSVEVTYGTDGNSATEVIKDNGEGKWSSDYFDGRIEYSHGVVVLNTYKEIMYLNRTLIQNSSTSLFTKNLAENTSFKEQSIIPGSVTLQFFIDGIPFTVTDRQVPGQDYGVFEGSLFDASSKVYYSNGLLYIQLAASEGASYFWDKGSTFTCSCTLFSRLKLTSADLKVEYLTNDSLPISELAVLNSSGTAIAYYNFPAINFNSPSDYLATYLTLT